MQPVTPSATNMLSPNPSDACPRPLGAQASLPAPSRATPSRQRCLRSQRLSLRSRLAKPLILHQTPSHFFERDAGGFLRRAEDPRLGAPLKLLAPFGSKHHQPVLAVYLGRPVN